MHELDMIDKIFNLIADEAKKNGMNRVIEVHLKVGRMTGLEKQHFEAALAARKEEMFEGVTLAIIEVPVELSCTNCNNSFVDERFEDQHFAHATSHAPDLYAAPSCPACHKEGATLVSGNELKLVSIDGD